MPWEVRLLRFHELSEEAFRKAEASHATLRAEYLALGTSWYVLAKETEMLVRERRGSG